MSERNFKEDNVDRILYHSIPINRNSFKGLWTLSTFFSRKKPERMEKLTISSEKKQVEIEVETPKEVKKFQTIEI